MRRPTLTFKQPTTVSIPTARTPDNAAQALKSMPKCSREEAEISALFQRLPKMLASLESLSETGLTRADPRNRVSS